MLTPEALALYEKYPEHVVAKKLIAAYREAISVILKQHRLLMEAIAYGATPGSGKWEGREDAILALGEPYEAYRQETPR